MSEGKLTYPKARRCGCTIDKYHGKKVPDAYRWLEEHNTDDVKSFVTEQTKFTEEYLKKCPFREDIRKRLTEFVNFPIMYCPTKEGKKYFYYKSNGSQNQKVLYMQDSLNGSPIIVLDPNTLSVDGTVAIINHTVSKNGNIIAIKTTEKGSDWATVRFKDLNTMVDLPDVLENLKVFITGVCWSHDSLGVFYAGFSEQKQADAGTGTDPLENEKLYYHKIRSGQGEDILISEFPENPKWFNNPIVSDCGKYLVNQVYPGPQYNLIMCAELQGPIQNEKLNFLPIISVFEADYDYVTNDGTTFYFVTNKDAPNYRLVGIDISNPEEGSWKTLISEDNDKVLSSNMKAVDGNKLVAMYTQDVRNTIQLHNLIDGSVIKAYQTDMGNVTAFSAERNLSEFFYVVSSFISPQKIYYVNLGNTSEPKTYFPEPKLQDFDPAKFVTVQVVYPSKDGSKVPMYIVKQKTTFQNGDSPCLLYGYGGFNVPLLPIFNPYYAFFVQHFDAIVAIANIRGGGELGSQWHEDGSNFCKQNSFDDFQAAANYLIDNYYTNKNKLAIRGVSNGGLLIGACINQRPDLFRAAIAQKGVFDMLRFHKFTIGNNWCVEYGCSDNPEQFEYLSTYSPLHNVRMPADSQYPAVLVTTADHDDRVPPLHSYKFVAELQSAIGHHIRQKNPLLIRIDSNSGHGLGASLGKLVQEWTDIFSFLAQELNLTFK